ncbi:MAG: site-2 protease family protein [Dehalococcoidia bacterium]
MGLFERIKQRKLNWNIILLLATIGTTLGAGYQFSIPLVNEGLMDSSLHGAATFSFGLLAILGCHEMGHKLMADRRGVEATFPYFIPVPFFLGTFGAVIKMKSTPPDRNALFDVGAAGPIAGFIVLIPLTLLGLAWSFPVALDELEGAMSLPSPLLLNWLSSSLTNIPTDGDLLLHPLALACWVGMIITMLNLLPVSMLDGGHITRALFGGRYHRIVSFIGAGVTFALGYWLFGILILIFAIRAKHPGPVDDSIALSSARKVVAVGLLAILIICAVPLYQSLLP